MSARLAAGWARSRSQSVSVVPTIQCVPHGMTNSTDFSVRRIRPVSELMRSRGTTMCTPLDALHLELAAPAGELLDLVGPHAGAVDDDARRTSPYSPVSTSLELGADDPLAVALEVGRPARR